MSKAIELRDSGLSSSLDFLIIWQFSSSSFCPEGEGRGAGERQIEAEKEQGLLDVSDGHSRGGDKIGSSRPPNPEASPGLGRGP